MRKLICTLAIALGAFFSVNAQEVGGMWVGGTVGLWSSKVKGSDSELSFKVLPEFGYVISDNIGIGISLGGGHIYGESLNFKDGKQDGEETNYYRVNPFLRYAFLKGSMGSLFFDGGVGYEHHKVCNGGAKSQRIDVGLRPGLALNVSEKVSLIGKFGFLGYQYSKAEKVKTNSFGFDFDMDNVELGIALKF